MNTKKQILHHPQRFQRAKEIKVVQSFKLARIKNKIWYQKQILDHPKKIPKSKKRPRSFKKQLHQRKVNFSPKWCFTSWSTVWRWLGWKWKTLWSFDQNDVSHHDQQFEGDLAGKWKTLWSFDQNDVPHHDQQFEPLFIFMAMVRRTRLKSVHVTSDHLTIDFWPCSPR